MDRREPTASNYDLDEAEGFDDSEQLRDLNTPENRPMSKQIVRTVNQSMDRLPEQLRVATMWREIEGRSYQDVAKMLVCRIGALRFGIFRGREACAEQLRPPVDIAKDKIWRRHE